jgi:hypothetical protein
LPEVLTEVILSVLGLGRSDKDQISLHAAMCACRDFRMAGSRLMTYAMIKSPADLGRFPRMATLKRLAVYGIPVQDTLVMLRTLPASIAGRLRMVESFTLEFKEVSVDFYVPVVHGGGANALSCGGGRAP